MSSCVALTLCMPISNRLVCFPSTPFLHPCSSPSLVPLPYAAAYASSKAAVHAFSEVLRMELAGFNIKVNAVCPGAIKSSIGDSGAKAISVRPGSWYKNVEDMVRCESLLAALLSGAASPCAATFRRPFADGVPPRLHRFYRSWPLQTAPSTRRSAAQRLRRPTSLRAKSLPSAECPATRQHTSSPARAASSSGSSSSSLYGSAPTSSAGCLVSTGLERASNGLCAGTSCREGEHHSRRVIAALR